MPVVPRTTSGKWSDAYPSWHVPYLFLAAALAEAGEQQAAKKALGRFNHLYELGSIKTLIIVRRNWPMQPPQEKIFHRGLKAAGMKGPNSVRLCTIACKFSEAG